MERERKREIMKEREDEREKEGERGRAREGVRNKEGEREREKERERDKEGERKGEREKQRGRERHGNRESEREIKRERAQVEREGDRESICSSGPRCFLIGSGCRQQSLITLSPSHARSHQCKEINENKPKSFKDACARH